MEHHIILVLEGGGAKGPIHVGELSYLEGRLSELKNNPNLKLVDFIDLFVTTSIGGVEASIYCTGKLSVPDFWDILEPSLKSIFTAKRPWSIPRYDWKSYLRLYEKNIGKDVKFSDTKSDFMFTTVDMVTGRNHFPKSWKEKYADHGMPELVHRTFAAPLFFGGVYDAVEKAIWSDGGVGFFNLPLIEAYAQALTNGWLEEGHHTHILALGTGRKQYRLDFKKESKKRAIRKAVFEIKRFFSKDDGGMARAVSAHTQINTLKKFERGYKGRLSFQWVDWFPMPKKLDKMDNWKARFSYYNKGKQLGTEIDLNPFKEKLSIK